MTQLNSNRVGPARTIVLLALLLLAISSPIFAQQKSEGVKRRLALVGGKIYLAPFAKPISNGVVLIENGKITSVGPKSQVHVPPDVETINCTGQTILAGFWNSHVHFTEGKWQNAPELPAAKLTAQLQQMLTGYGFTSVVDTGSLISNTAAIRRRIESGEVAGPRILTAGIPLYPKDGIPYYVIDTTPPDLVKMLSQPATPEEALRAVDNNIAQGADIIKLFVVTWVNRDGKHVPVSMSPEIVQAAVTEAHRKGKLVFAHPSNIDGVELVLGGHVDVLAHTIEDPEHWSDLVVARLKAAKITLIPTLTLFSQENGFDGILREVKSYSDAGGQIIFGTDVGYLTNYSDLTKEYELLGRAGLTFPQILAALTTEPVERFGLTATTGRVATGLDADLVVLYTDPARDLMLLSHVRMTLRRGRIIYRAPAQ